MTPLQLQMMLHYYAIAEPYACRQSDHANSPEVMRQREELIVDKLIEVVLTSFSGYQCTARGKAYVEMLCAMPLPVCKWVAP